ncbi:MAG: DUF262 domain-containing protein [Sphingobacterium sp.]|jgi:hypothetical protein|nr:DUF262 domain-containing protein [Sphingobacterium sp.]
MQERFEVTREGMIDNLTPYNFDEVKTLEDIFAYLNLDYSKEFTGRGGYLRYRDNSEILNIYLKKVTFGGRDNRPYEKRLQFSAALDRTGYDRKDNTGELSLILGIYKWEDFSDNDAIICAWDINDWGKNIGRAFNCFIDLKKIQEAILNGVAQHITSTGQIAYAFKISKFKKYLELCKQKGSQLNERYNEEALQSLFSNSVKKVDTEFDSLPKFYDLFQPIIDVLQKHEGVGTNDQIEEWIAEKLKISEFDLFRIHNPSEGNRTELGYRLAWARFYLKKGGYIDNPQRGIWVLTDLDNSSLILDKDFVIGLATETEFKDAEENVVIRSGEEEDGVEIEVEENYLEEDIVSPFDPNKVDIRTRSMSLDLLLKRMKRESIDMNTSFQRRAGLWTISKKSQLIESILIRIPLPVFYFDGSDDDNWLVVDGLQRLSTLDEFVNKESFSLNGLEYLSAFKGMKFSDLPGHLQRRIEEFEITAYVISPGTPIELKFNIFKRINTGGLILTQQEIRNALYPGVSEFLKKLAESPAFRKATSFSVSDKRMLDREFVLRFLAFRLLEMDAYSGDLDAFLNKALGKLDDCENSLLIQLEIEFYQSMEMAWQIFGEYAFRKRYSNESKKYPINKALFEVWTVLFSRLEKGSRDLIIREKERVNDLFLDLMNEDIEFNASITSGTNKKQNVYKRFESINNILQTVLLL